MTAMAAPPEALGATPQSLTGPPDAGPPGPGFQGALEDSMARTATAEGQHEKQSASKAAGGREAATDPEALAGAGQPGSTAAGPAASRSERSEETPGFSDTEGQTSGADGVHDKGRLHSADAKASAKASTDLVSQISTSATDASATLVTSTVAATAAANQAQSGVAALASGLATLDTVSAGKTGSTAAPGQVAASAGNSQRDVLPGTASSKAASATQPGTQDDPATPDAPPASSTAPSASVLTQSKNGTVTPGGQPTPTNGSPASNLRLHLPWLDSSAPSGTKVTGTGNIHASATPLKEVAAQVRSGSTSPTQTASRSTGASGHFALGGQNLTAADHPANATQSSLTDEASVQGTSAAGEANTAGGPAAAAAPNVGAQALPWTYGANMQETIETIHATVALASRQGAAQAQISLEPAELGAVRIHLTQTGEGLVARVSAETAAGAQAIASGQSELHNTLSSLGISLLRLDVGSFTQQQAQAGGQSPQRSQQQPARLTLAGEQAEEIAAASPTSTVSLSSTSALIDVLA